MKDSTYTFHRSHPYDLLNEDDISWYDRSDFIDNFEYVIDNFDKLINQDRNECEINLSFYPKTRLSQPKTCVHLDTGASIHINDHEQNSNNSDFCFGERQS